MRVLLVLLGLATAARAESPRDAGLYPELSAAVEASLRSARPAPIPAGAILRVDARRGLATLQVGADPRKVYPYPLDEAARAELAEVAPGWSQAEAPSAEEDHDGDGIVDRLDILRGAKKLVLNRARYYERYAALPYPGGDVPRTEGVCTDTVIRALRNAGIDLQRAVHEDLLSARASYPMVERVDASINHRRVKTLRAWFQRHFASRPTDGDFQPGDIVFFDTFPQRSGAEHMGVVSDSLAPDGQPLIVNNWTNGSVDAEMALLGAVPVTDHFRAQARPARTRRLR